MTRLRLALLLLFVAGCASVATTSAAPQLREQIWTQHAPNLAHTLTHAPRECLSVPQDEALRQSVEIGRALFRSPALLGGPAARTGLSCNACHSNGRVNAAFLLPELTNRVGAADVTSEWASKVRGDGVMNPRDIPDLAGVRDRSTHGQHNDPSLEHFTRSVIEEEFQGARPPDQAFVAVISYLRALDACPLAETPATLADAAEDVRRGFDAARGAEPHTAALVLLATQDAVGRIVERLPAQDFAADRRALEGLARDLGVMRNAGAEVGAALDAQAPGWSARFDAAVARIAPHERRTYFNEDRVRADLAPS